MSDTWTITEQSTSLRDQFAMAALQGDWAAQDGEYIGVWDLEADVELLTQRARLYYRMADAMLKAREVQP